MPLRGKQPKDIQKRLKFFMYGKYKVGKTTAAIQMPRPYIIDTERGTENYKDLIEKSGGAVFQTDNIDEVLEEITTLYTEKHDFLTLVIDPITKIEDALILKLEDRMEKDGSKDSFAIWRGRDRMMKKLTSLLIKLDMNVVITAHEKIEYGEKMIKLGTTFSAWKNWPYTFDLIIKIKKIDARRNAIIEGSRVKGFPEDEIFEWNYENLLKRFDKEVMEKISIPEILANEEEVNKIEKLLEIVKVKENWEEKCFSKADVDSWNEMPQDKILACITTLEKKQPKGE